MVMHDDNECPHGCGCGYECECCGAYVCDHIVESVDVDEDDENYCIECGSPLEE